MFEFSPAACMIDLAHRLHGMVMHILVIWEIGN